MFKSLVPDGTVTMFEPDPDNARLLRKTATRFKVDVNVVEAAVCNEDRSATFYADNLTAVTGSLEHSARDFIAKHHGRAPSEVTVKCLSLDGVSDRVDPDFMKIDVEGAELSVFRRF